MTALVVVGQGYVGPPVALCAARVGLSVVGLDTNARVVDALNSGNSHIGDLSNGELAVLESTTYPGTTEEVFAPLVPGSRFTSARTFESPSRLSVHHQLVLYPTSNSPVFSRVPKVKP